MKRKTKTNTKRSRKNGKPSRKAISQWDETLQAVSKNDKPSYRNEKATGLFTADEIGQPDSDVKPDQDNPLGVQGGRGPLNEEGEGDRQNDQIAELEADVDAKEDLERRR